MRETMKKFYRERNIIKLSFNEPIKRWKLSNKEFLYKRIEYVNVLIYILNIKTKKKEGTKLHKFLSIRVKIFFNSWIFNIRKKKEKQIIHVIFWSSISNYRLQKPIFELTTITIFNNCWPYKFLAIQYSS